MNTMRRKKTMVLMLVFCLLFMFGCEEKKPYTTNVYVFEDVQLIDEYAKKFEDEDLKEINSHINQLKNFYMYVMEIDSYDLYEKKGYIETQKNGKLILDEDWTTDIIKSKYMNTTYNNEDVENFKSYILDATMYAQLYISDSITIDGNKPIGKIKSDIKKCKKSLIKIINFVEAIEK